MEAADGSDMQIHDTLKTHAVQSEKPIDLRGDTQSKASRLRVQAEAATTMSEALQRSEKAVWFHHRWSSGE